MLFMSRIQRLGEMLTSKGLITETELDKALQEQVSTKKKLGEILVENNIISHSIFTLFLAQQLGIEYIVDDNTLMEKLAPINTQLSQLETARYQAILLGTLDEYLYVGIADPYDFEMLRELVNILNTNVKFVLLTSYIFTKYYCEHFYQEALVA
jgi:type IV pilus assembly protein PilB